MREPLRPLHRQQQLVQHSERILRHRKKNLADGNRGGPRSENWKYISGQGSYAMKASSVEAAFPLAAFSKYVTTGAVYSSNVYTCCNEGSRVIGVDSTLAKQLRF